MRQSPTRNIFGLNPPQAVTPNGPRTAVQNYAEWHHDHFWHCPGALSTWMSPRVRPHRQRKNPTFSAKASGQDDIEVTHIDENKNVVTFNNHGVVQEIPLVKAPPITTPTPVVMNTRRRRAWQAADRRLPGGGGRRSEMPARFGNRFGQNQNRNMGNNARE